MTFIVSSHFITVLGGEDVDLEMQKKFFFGKIWKELVKLFFQSIGAKKS
jgi:hypothetical protein